MSCDPNLEKNKYEQAEGRAEARDKENQPSIFHITWKLLIFCVFRYIAILDSKGV